jgi:hypothetical protein
LTPSNAHWQPQHFISSGVSHGTPPFQKFVVFSVICSPGPWICSQMVLGRSLLPSWRSGGPPSNAHLQPQHFISSGVSHGTPPFQKFVVFSVICSPGPWICSQMVLGRSLLPSWRSGGPPSNAHLQPQHFISSGVGHGTPPFQKFVVFSVICSPGPWICSQFLLGQRV